MTQSTNLVTFLRARLDEDEARTRADDTRSQWHTATCGYDINEFVYECSCGVPAQVLRDVEAKRRIVDEHQPRLTGFVRTLPGESLEDTQRRFRERTEQVCPTCLSSRGRAPAPCPTLRLLALPYDSHPDYREEWKP